ncbi:MAG TPA: hypothetical protein VMH28_18125 [Candidatus Acidoferrales bacterium]|nr:hypothetical protein [Candidatus Acidoferrales bacterium]
MIAEEAIVIQQEPTVPATSPAPHPSTESALAAEVSDFTLRHVLEQDAQFFDG